MKRKTFLLICAVLIAALLIGVLAACDPGSKEQGGSQTPGGTQLPGNGGGGGTQTPGDNDQDDEQGGEVIEPAKLIFEKTDAGYSVTGYEGTPTAVVIPDTYEGLPVTSIGFTAFQFCTSLTSVTIPDSVTSIGLGAFTLCPSLERLTVAPDNPVYHSAGNCIIKTATKTLIQGCNNSVIPSDGSVTSIGDMAFAGCTSLTSITIPESVTSIGGYAFAYCPSLERLTVAPGNPKYHSAGNCVIETATDTLIKGCKGSIIPADGSVMSIGSGAFAYCDSLTSVTIPDSVTSIEDYAFHGCYKLIEVCNKSSLDITAGSSSYGYVAYYAKHVYTEEGGSWLSDTEDGFRFLYDGETGYLVAYLGDETRLTLPESFIAHDGTEVSEYQINDYAFSLCNSPTSVTIPDSVTSIGNSAFSGCTSLTSITIPESVTSIGQYAFSGCAAEIIWGGTPTITEIGGYAFAGYAGTSIAIPDSVTSIGDNAFMSCSSLTSVTIPDGATSIGEFAFDGCSSLTAITIPDSVWSIGSEAFAGCDSLKAVYITDIRKWAEMHFASCDANPLFYAGNLYLNGELVTDLVIPDSVTTIGSHAFSRCTSLTSVTIPDSVWGIGNGAFFWCTSLTSVTIGSSVINISDSSFSGCFKLIEVCNKSPLNITAGSSDHGDVSYFAKHVYREEGGSWLSDTEDGFRFFWDGEVGNLVAYLGSETELTLPDSFMAYDETEVTSYQIYERAFYYERDDLAAVTIPDSVTSIGREAFYNCASLTSIAIPDSVTSIGSQAFYDCTSLTAITIPDSVTSIGSYAFSNCTGLNSIHYTGDMASWLEKNWHSSVMSSGRALYIGGIKVEGELVIPNGTTSIPSYAFAYQAGITSVTIPDSVTSIGDDAFYSCDSLESVHITDIGKWVAIDFANYAANPLYYAGNLYLNGELVTDLVIPDSVTRIEEGTFENCTSLTSVTIGSGVTSIALNAFNGCHKLIEVYNKSSLDITAGNWYVYAGEYAKHVYTEEGGSWFTDTEDGFRFFYDGETGYLVAYLGSETELTLPDSFTAYDGTEVTNYQIYDYAFYERNDLTSVTIPDSVVSIGIAAFRGCTSLVSVTIPDSVTSIGSSAFVRCTAEIIWGGTPTITEIGDYAFAHYAGTSITIPDSVTSIGNCVIYGCFSLTSVTIPDSVESIGIEAFSVCDSLALVTFEGTMAEWKAINKDSNWKYDCPFTEVVCSDGVVEV